MVEVTKMFQKKEERKGTEAYEALCKGNINFNCYFGSFLFSIRCGKSK